MGPAFTGKMYEVALSAGAASRPGASGFHFCSFVPPHVEREQSSAQVLVGTYEKLDRFGRRN